MPHETSRSAVFPSPSPSEAYASDLERMRRSVPIGGCDDGWLVLAHALHRCSLLTSDEARPTLARAADAIAINAIAAGMSAHSTLLRSARAFRAMSEPAPLLECGHATALELFVVTQAVAEEQELAGAFCLAFATLNSLLGAFSYRVPPRARGIVLAQLGRVVRQLGALDLAQEYYEAAMQLGFEHDALDVVARALLGLGALALMRGNYPKARKLFERALVNADGAHNPELIRSAHHGLQNCGLASGDFDSALVHGWNVLRLCISPDSRAEALMNMAEICRMTGEDDAAMRVYAVAMDWSTNKRVRLHALSGALRSAVKIDRLTEARRFLAEIDELMPTVADVYAQASVGVEIAGSLFQLGDTTAASALLERSSALAVENFFHEVVHQAEQQMKSWANASPPIEHVRTNKRRIRLLRSESFRQVLRSLKDLTSAAL